ncbi:MAG: hypothetical protein AUK47_16740 [Deltaproteobacteria bacterium CG2_30_63_29]|nr:MAG: hypothetical protein AUK47_16740 [Deltaproteobacteria bacterium CG2_30_63_29]
MSGSTHRIGLETDDPLYGRVRELLARLDAVRECIEFLSLPVIANEDAERTAEAIGEFREAALGEPMQRLLGKNFREFAHELRDPLTLLEMNLELLRHPLCPPDERLISSSALHTGFEQVQSLLCGLVECSDEETPSPMELNDEIRSTLSLLHPRLAPVCVHTELQALSPIAAIGRQPIQVLVNLLKNAAAATPVANIWVNTSAHNGQVRLEVRDDGCGMGPEVRRRLFERGFTTKPDAGAGLGMSITQSIVSRHRAALTIESEEGVGTRICVDWPAAKVYD